MTTIGETRVLPEDLATTREKLAGALADSSPPAASPDKIPNVLGPGGR